MQQIITANNSKLITTPEQFRRVTRGATGLS